MDTFSIAWWNGMSAFILVCAAWCLVIYCIYLYNKLHVKTYLGGLLLFSAIGLGWMGITLTFLSVEFTGINQPWVEPIMSYFSYSTIPLGCFAIVYLVWELVGSKKSKKIIYLLYVVLFISYYVLLYGWMPQNVVQYGGATDLLDDWIDPTTFFFYFIWILVSITAVITLMGFLKMRSKTTGELKTRSTLLILATPTVAIGILADTVVLGAIPIFAAPGHANFLYLIRALMIIGVFLIIIAFRPSEIIPLYVIIGIVVIIFIVFIFI